MKKIFGFFTNKKNGNKVFFGVVATLMACVLLLGGLAITKLFAKPQGPDEISKGLNTYNLDINYEGNYKFNAKQTLSYKNNTDTDLEYLKLNLYPMAFSEGATNKPVSSLKIDEAYPNGVSYGVFKIDSVKLNNTAASWEQTETDKNVLKVSFADQLKQNGTTSLEIAFSFTLPNILHRYGYGPNVLNIANFYPILGVFEDGEFVTDVYNYNGDPFYSDMANYNVNLTVPKNFEVAHSGELIESDNLNNSKVLRIQAKAVRDFAFVMSEKFSVIEDKVGNTTIKYYYHKDQNAAASLQAAKDSIITFNELFGLYPYKNFSVVETGFVHGGMEYPNLVYINDAIEKHTDYVNVIVHETAHQWWYQLVGSNAFARPWLDEGLTEYSTVLFYEKNPSYKVTSQELVAMATTSYVSFIQLCEKVLGNVDTSMSRNLSQYDTEQEYVYITYVKGMLFFDSLRTLVGNKAFEKSIKHYFESNKFKNVTEADLLYSFEKTSLKSLESFFASWIEGKVVINNFS